MFTGIIEELGTILDIGITGRSGSISIKASKVLEGTRIGDSIAVNGTCLTVTAVSADSFRADVMPETLKKTSLSIVRRGDLVNLERTMAADGRFGGHIVSGHIDGTGTIREYKNDGNAVWVTIGAEPSILRGIVMKGSVAIDGISLTVAHVDDTCFKVSVIPHTGEETTLLKKRAGDPVNLETDIIGKYVARLLSMPAESSVGNTSTGLTMDMLRDFLE